MATGKIPQPSRDSGWKTLTGSSYSGSIYYRKIGNVVEVLADDLSGISGSVNFGYLPAEYLPSHTVFAPAFRGYNHYDVIGMVRIYAGGMIQFTVTTGSSISSDRSLSFNATFFAG